MQLVCRNFRYTLGYVPQTALLLVSLVDIESCGESCRLSKGAGCPSYSAVIPKMTQCVDSGCPTTVMPGGGIWTGGSRSAVQVSECEFCRLRPVHPANGEPWRPRGNRGGCGEIPEAPARRPRNDQRPSGIALRAVGFEVPSRGKTRAPTATFSVPDHFAPAGNRLGLESSARPRIAPDSAAGLSQGA